jgi:succinyl-diaminopimelate desuccinylase
VSNLYGRRGTTFPHLCFAGHTDVVPAGDRATWTSDPFGAEIRNEKLYGRGVVDMKGAIGAWLSAVDKYLLTSTPSGSLSILLTTDEEGPGIGGIQYIVEQFKARGEKIDVCLVGEPTNRHVVGDTIKTGRRGSLNATLSVQGKAGHVAYPHLATNPVVPMLNYLQALLGISFDSGMSNFDPTHLEITSLDTGNPTSNVIPDQIRAKFNIRFNPLHTIESLTRYLTETTRQISLPHTLDIQARGEAFFCDNKRLQDLVREAVHTVTGVVPALSTGGGTSDGRFLKDICPVIEFGLVSATAHQANEHIAVKEIYTLTDIYQKIIETFFLS